MYTSLYSSNYTPIRDMEGEVVNDTGTVVTRLLNLLLCSHAATVPAYYIIARSQSRGLAPTGSGSFHIVHLHSHMRKA